ncbi:MAG: phytoene desaturase family protein [Candidatus Nanopelagicales bacterium]
MARVVVVGAGMGGLAAAARLRVKGHSVLVLEQGPRAGGKLDRFERDGFVFDSGPSLLTLPAVYRDLFLKTGEPFENAVDLQPLDTAFGYRFADGSTLNLPGVDPGRIAAAMGQQLGGRAQQDWNELMVRAGEVWRITRGPFITSPLTGASTLIKLATDPREVRAVAPFTTLRKFGRRHLSDPRQVTILDRYATYQGSDPRRAPAALMTIPYVEQAFGAWHLGGGIATLADALTTRCLERGVEIRTDADVVSIITTTTGVSGVQLRDGEHIDADIVVANVDASTLYADLIDDPRARKPLRTVRRATPSLSGFVIMAGVRGRTEGIHHHNVWFPADYDAEFDAVFGGRPVADPTIYACVPDDPRMRPDEDCESWFILINAARDGSVNWGAEREEYADHVLDVLARRGVDLRSRMLWREIRTPADLARRYRAPGGSIYGTSSNGLRASFLRPANISPVPGLYLVGGSSHPGGGLPLVGLGADIVAEAIGRA